MPRQPFQSTLPARGATRNIPALSCKFSISIHAPRTGSDLYTRWESRDILISIHAPRTGSDTMSYGASIDEQKLQSTLPARGATGYDALGRKTTVFQSTLPARGATLFKGGKDDFGKVFQSTLPARGATWALRMGTSARYFNPRSPHGERRQLATELGNVESISIHAPRTGSDLHWKKSERSPLKISIHAPRTGSDGDVRA